MTKVIQFWFPELVIYDFELLRLRYVRYSTFRVRCSLVVIKLLAIYDASTTIGTSLIIQIYEASESVGGFESGKPSNFGTFPLFSL
jgi:hypothetical protein